MKDRVGIKLKWKDIKLIGEDEGKGCLEGFGKKEDIWRDFWEKCILRKGKFWRRNEKDEKREIIWRKKIKEERNR